MQVGRFFSLQKGRVGQYLSPRVLVVKTPFRAVPDSEAGTYFGFEKLPQAQNFALHLASCGYRFQLRRAQMLKPFPYEIKLFGTAAIATLLAHWDRVDQQQLSAERWVERSWDHKPVPDQRVA
ncbi:hypothetical protein [Myxacorys almedinensis]|uniref:Uncharacterized protein n=1 Tax=Myxacorys almedinensis A TaxID=2690445 RepID=A0A8J8CNM7_9CYAN|nr:hypothetical protein [Myxacorys almedinensis]NDJ19730.1 hypothetical protein [Myxacorys almedinensis A]